MLQTLAGDFERRLLVMKRIRKGVYFFEGSGGPIGGMPIKASVRTRTAGEPFASLPTTTVNMFWNIAGGITVREDELDARRYGQVANHFRCQIIRYLCVVSCSSFNLKAPEQSGRMLCVVHVVEPLKRVSPGTH